MVVSGAVGAAAPRARRLRLVALLLASCSGSDGGGDAVATTTTVRRTPAVEAPLAVGQCGDVPRIAVGGALDPAALTEVDCAQPHDVEVAALFDFPAGDDVDFPGAAAVDGYATEQCLDRFEPYVGAPYDTSALDFIIVAPDGDGWDDGDRRIACVLYHVDFQDLTGPVAASGR